MAVAAMAPVRRRLLAFFEEPLAEGALRRRCAVVALVLVVAVFADVVFLRASLSLANLYNFSQESEARPVSLFPERWSSKPNKGRQVFHGMSDAGGSIFQSEPMQHFMARVLRDGESPYWNPYSAAGSLGPETLIDLKFSPISILVALTGGADWAFHAAYLGFCFLGAFTLMCFLAAELRLSLIAATAGAIGFLLNGYHAANVAANVAQTWLFFPLPLLAIAVYARSPSPLGFVAMVAAFLPIVATTFLPTTSMVLGTVLLLGGAAALGHALAAGRPRHAVWTIGASVAALAAALAVLAPLYLPVAEAMVYLRTGQFYAARTFFPATLVNLASVFTPKHAFEVYGALPLAARGLIGNHVFHQGIVAALLVSQAARSWPIRVSPVPIAAAALAIVLLGRVFGVPGLSDLVEAISVLGSIGEQYLWVAISIAVVLLVPFGVEALLTRGVAWRPAAATAVLIVAALAYASIRFGGVRTGIAAYYLVVALALIGGTLVLLRRMRDHGEQWAHVLVLLLLVELTFYVNHLRLTRDDRLTHPPDYVAFLQQHLGFHRIASFGPYGVPAEYGSAFGLAQIESMNFDIFPEYLALFDRLMVPDPAERWPSFASLIRKADSDAVNLAALDLLSVRYVIVPASWPRLLGFLDRNSWRRAFATRSLVVLENPAPAPRAWIVHRLDERALTPVDAGLSPRGVAFTEDSGLLAAAERLGLSGESPAPDEGAAIVRYGHAKLELRATLGGPGILVLNDSWHPNWRAWVDGVETPIGRVDQAFRGLALPPGEHRIEMRYRPATLDAGLWISGVSLAGLALFAGSVLWSRRGVRKARDPGTLRPVA